MIAPDPVEEASRLVKARVLPVDVFALASELGVLVTYSDGVGPEGRVALQDAPVISLARPKGDSIRLRHRLRFTLAHELGHVALYRRDSIVSTPSNYWTLEAWCDRFANAVLLPLEEVRRRLPQGSTSWHSFLHLPRNLARASDASLAVAVYALGDLPEFEFDYLRLGSRDDRITVTASTVGGSSVRLGINAHIKRTADYAALNAIEPGGKRLLKLESQLGTLSLPGREVMALRNQGDWLLVMRRLQEHRPCTRGQLSFEF